jgi:hypothetical protein
MGNKRQKTARHIRSASLLLAIGLLVSTVKLPGRTSALPLTSYVPNRSLQLSSSQASLANVSYVLSFTTITLGPIGSIELEICDNDPFPGLPCTAPAGFDASSVTISPTQTGAGGFSIHPNSTINRILLTRGAAVVPANTAVSYTLGNITNPSAERTYYGRIRTFASTDGTGADTDEGGLAFAINALFTVSTEVPPVLDFCVAVSITGADCSGAGGSYVDFGTLKSTATSSATSQFMIATNAQSGYSVTLSGTTLTAGNALIPALATPLPPLLGTSQFGFNLRQNTNPSVGNDPSGSNIPSVSVQYNTPNLYRFVSGDVLVSAPVPSDYTKYTASYIVNVDKNQHPGVYATTLSFIALGSF